MSAQQVAEQKAKSGVVSCEQAIAQVSGVLKQQIVDAINDRVGAGVRFIAINPVEEAVLQEFETKLGYTVLRGKYVTVIEW
jgi:hypothetical protein